MAFTNRSLTLVDNSLRRRLSGVRAAPTIRKMARPVQETAAAGTGGGFSGGFSSDIQSVGYFGAGTQYRTFDAFLPDNSEETLIPFYRDIYYYDAVGGSAVDMTSTFPFSDWTLTGIDNKFLSVYSETLARLNMRTLLPEMLLSYLVDGDFIGTLIYDPGIKNFYDIMIHDRVFCQVIPSPFYSMDPIIRAQGSAKLKYYAGVGSKYAEQVMRNYPQHLLNALESGTVELDPLTTLHLARRSLPDRMSGSVSYLKRLLPIYLLEKTLYRGTLVEFNKRMRATTHIQAGDDTWEPTEGELEELLRQFQSTELDPLGAWIVTRQGVNVQDVRQGGDFAKWTDMTETLVPLKLRSLGISEAFLSGEANYSNCLVGSTLIPTTQGLRRIDSFGKGKNGDRQVIKVRMDSRYGVETATSWLYQGYRPTTKVTTETGNSITATGNHPVLIFENGETKWKRTSQLEVGDILCVSRNKVVRTTPLKLGVGFPKARNKLPSKKKENRSGNQAGLNPNSHKHPSFQFAPGHLSRVPSYMTPGLAYWLALFISEGSTIKDRFSKEGGAYALAFGNTNKALIGRFAELSSSLFGIEPVITYTPLKRLKNQNPLATKGWYSAVISNRRLMDWLEAIGVYVKPGKVEGKNPSYFKVVPWSVLQADEKSQLAFLAAYAECDGSVERGTQWFSKSRELVDQLLAILNSHGYQPTKQGLERVALSREDSEDLWSRAGEYLTERVSRAEGGKYSKWDGVPAKFWVDLVMERKISSDRYGAYYRADSGKELCWSKNKNSVTGRAAPWGFNPKEIRRFNYRYYEEGKYDNFLAFLAQLSPSAHAKLLRAFKTRYRYTQVTSLVDAGKQHVYDISMRPGVEPAFVANGLVVHNTEAALTVFMENIDTLRNYVTMRTFNYKLFPLVAIANGFYKKGAKVPKNSNLREILFNVNNQKDLEIPKLIWNKDLTSKEGSSKIEMLDKLAEKGMPIALRTWAAAANVDISSLLSDLSEESEDTFASLLTNYKAAMKKIQGADADSGDGGFGGGQFASSVPHQPLRRRGILSRDFGDPKPHVLGRTGKPKAVLNEHAHMRKENEAIAKAALRLQDPNRRAAVKRQVTNRFGRIPKVL